MNQKDVWEDLLSILRAEHTAYHHLATLLTQEHDALRQMAQEAILELTEKKKSVLEQLRFCDQRRTQLFNTLLGHPSIQSPLDWVQHLSQAQRPWGAQAATEFREVLNIAQQVAKQGRQNAELTHRGLAVVREALRLIYSAGEGDPTYQGSGSLRLPPVTSSLSVHG